MDTPVFERFISLAKREILADDVRLLAQDEAPPQADNVVVARLPDGRHVVASFESAPKDGEALARRLAMLASTFAEALATPPSERTRARPPVVSSLHEELKAVAARAHAKDVVVIDVDSPVVWGCASVPGRPRARPDLGLREVGRRGEASNEPPEREIVPAESSPTASMIDDHDEEPADEPDLTRRIIAAIRRLPTLDGLHKGRHLRHVAREGNCFLAMSFSGIYILALAFDDAFDELRAERAAQESLGRIERLVLALPPLDPTPAPMGGVVALRRPRRR
jgi:hypothetical protein